MLDKACFPVHAYALAKFSREIESHEKINRCLTDTNRYIIVFYCSNNDF